ncbi:HNH endonuclease family protein [Phocaeicola fibrisolvens]|uniref:hypothetical protein n=1 Tax=Phocaeicola fibrisolvens TaxID=2981793 RepID=UPI000820DFED|nr:hypothetical protein [Phocaeicola fibrisolvens]MCU6779898.1 hypothetical protein [Phocaeicola fibrisolvens]SCI57044.1 Uncharacterised protein [uncultured Bacteroides sp.]
MILITKNKEPKEWTEYRNTPGVDYQAIPELVQSLLKEQGYICAYCMRRIPQQDKLYKKDGKNYVLTQEDHRVEHVKCRELHDDLKLEYTNMVICCPGHIGTDDHCDRLKGAKDISFTPLDQQFINTIKYNSDGTIISTNELYNTEINDILNLNTKLLKVNRKAMLTQVIIQINGACKKGKCWDKKTLELYLKKYSEKHFEEDEEGVKEKYYSYCGIVTWFIQKKLRTLG